MKTLTTTLAASAVFARPRPDVVLGLTTPPFVGVIPRLASVLRGRPVKLVKGGVLPGATEAAPGTVLGLREGRLAVAAGEGSVFGVELLQRPDKPARSAADFVNGERLVLDPASGERFGDD